MENKTVEEAKKAKKEAWFVARDLKQSSARLRKISEEEFL